MLPVNRYLFSLGVLRDRREHLINQLTYFVFRIKGTLSSHMEFHSYPMDVQTLRIQFAACVFIIGLHITI